MIGCDVTVIYDANGLKFDALNIVDPATGFQIPAVLPPRSLVGRIIPSASRRLGSRARHGQVKIAKQPLAGA